MQFVTSTEHSAPTTDIGSFFGLTAHSYRSNPWLKTAFTEKTETVCLKNDVVISSPWRKDRFIKTLSLIGKENTWGEWRKDSNHYIALLLPFRIAWFENGHHSGVTGVLKGEGYAEADEVYDASKLFNFMHTDGVNYYETSTGKQLSKVGSIEFAAAFELGRLL